MANGKTDYRWVRRLILLTFFLSIIFSIVSQALLGQLGLPGSLLVLLCIVFLGVVFDILGVAAAVASLPPLNAKAAKRLPGARQALDMARNAERVASICNDVIGDISGIVSGAAAAAIVFRLVTDNFFVSSRYLSIALSALVAALTVGGKAYGKFLAINRAHDILIFAGKILYYLQNPWPFRKEQKGKGRK